MFSLFFTQQLENCKSPIKVFDPFRVGFIQEERQQSSLLLLPVDSSVPSIFIRTQVAYSKTVSLGPLFCFIDLCMHLCSFYIVFLTMALEYNLKWSMVIFLELFCSELLYLSGVLCASVWILISFLFLWIMTLELTFDRGCIEHVDFFWQYSHFYTISSSNPFSIF